MLKAGKIKRASQNEKKQTKRNEAEGEKRGETNDICTLKLKVILSFFLKEVGEVGLYSTQSDSSPKVIYL
jgi:hypothetical protein